MYNKNVDKYQGRQIRGAGLSHILATPLQSPPPPNFAEFGALDNHNNNNLYLLHENVHIYISTTRQKYTRL